MKRTEVEQSSDAQRNPSVAKRSGLSGSLYGETEVVME